MEWEFLNTVHLSTKVLKTLILLSQSQVSNKHKKCNLIPNKTTSDNVDAFVYF